MRVLLLLLLLGAAVLCLAQEEVVTTSAEGGGLGLSPSPWWGATPDRVRAPAAGSHCAADRRKTLQPKTLQDRKRVLMPLADPWSAIGLVANRDLQDEDQVVDDKGEGNGIGESTEDTAVRLCDAPGRASALWHGYRLQRPALSVEDWPLVRTYDRNLNEVRVVRARGGGGDGGGDIDHPTGPGLDQAWLERTLAPALAGLNCTVNRVVVAENRVWVEMRRLRAMAELAGLAPARMPSVDVRNGAIVRRTLDVFSLEFRKIVPAMTASKSGGDGSSDAGTAGDDGVSSSSPASWCVEPRDPADGLTPPPRVVVLVPAAGPLEWVRCVMHDLGQAVLDTGLNLRLVVSYSYDPESAVESKRFDELKNIAFGLGNVKVFARAALYSRRAGLMHAAREAWHNHWLKDDDVAIFSDLFVTMPSSAFLDAVRHTAADRLAFAPALRPLDLGQAVSNAPRIPPETSHWKILALRGSDIGRLDFEDDDDEEEEQEQEEGGEGDPVVGEGDDRVSAPGTGDGEDAPDVARAGRDPVQTWTERLLAAGFDIVRTAPETCVRHATEPNHHAKITNAI